jgi:hypothetical protein
MEASLADARAPSLVDMRYHAVCDTTPCRVEYQAVWYRAAWDTTPCGIPRRVGYHAVWDTTPASIQYRRVVPKATRRPRHSHRRPARPVMAGPGQCRSACEALTVLAPVGSRPLLPLSVPLLPLSVPLLPLSVACEALTDLAPEGSVAGLLWLATVCALSNGATQPRL